MFKLKMNHWLCSRNYRELHVPHQYEKRISCAVISIRNNQTQSTGEVNNQTDEFSIEDNSLEEEIEKKRNKNRLPEFVYRTHMLKEVPDLILKHDFLRNKLKQRYGRYGKASKVNPGLLWPTKQELSDIVQYEEKHHLSLQDTVAKVQAKRTEREKERKDYEDLVDENMANLDKTMQAYYGKLAKTKANADAIKKKRELLIEEISEYLGYDVDPLDPKFKEAVDLKQKEKKKAIRAKKEKENYSKMLQKLSEIAEGSK